MSPVRKIPLNLFGIPFGLAGLGQAWETLGGFDHAPAACANVILVLSAASWLLVLGAYLLSAAGRPSVVRDDLLDPIAAPFASLAFITPMLLAAIGLYPHAESAGRALTDVFLVGTLLLGGWLTGQWIYGPLELSKLHPGYFLPTVAGGLAAGASAAHVGQHRLGELMFGLGLVCWLVLGSMIMARLFFLPTLPVPLRPTLAIEVAPAAVASLAWFQLHGVHVDAVVTGLAGYGLLMVVAQLRLLPLFLSLKFMPSTWAFTFSWAAVASTVLIWLQAERPAGYLAWQYVDLTVITAFIGLIALRTGVAMVRGQLLPQPNPPIAAEGGAPDAPTTSLATAKVG